METQNFTTTSDGKTAGIVSYFTIIGWLIAYFALHKDNRTALGSYQLRQTLMFHLTNIALSIVARVLIALTLSATIATVFWIVYIALFVIWIIGLIGAIQGQMKPIPVLGAPAQTTFSTI